MADKRINIQAVKDVKHVTFNESRILDESSIKAIYEEITELVEKTPRIKLILDFDQVDYLSSAVLGKLVALNKEVLKDKGHLVLANIKAPILEVFRITKLDKVLDIKENAFESMKSFGV
jgi:anti-sigma B factor antagonist